ncbi:amino acid adenylation domain-containing protein [Sphaerisporangium dianthi]|uniref:Amino acid adenylation domain-containing protein n=1 Tax=Sphaerisporangium dianthi TaxID=1436120 RepID=A0ABV9CGC6_9ACTN
MDARRTAPLTFGQERLWFLNHLDPHDASYNMFLALRLRGPLDVDALSRAFDELVRRHEPLRTRFPLTEAGPVQSIPPATPQEIELVEAGPGERRLAELVAERTNAPFDLTVDAPLRVGLLRVSPRDHVLSVVLHHIAGDGWSLDVLMSELVQLYNAFLRGEPSPLAPLPLTYGRHARAERDAGVPADVVAYWRDRLADAPVLDLPLDRPRPRTRSSAGGFVVRRAAPGLADRLAALAREERCTLFMVWLAAYQVLLCRHSGQSDICVGSPVAGRDRVELEPLVGYFTDTLVLRGDLSGDPTFREVLARTRETVLAAYEHRPVPLEQLTAGARDGGEPFQTLFTSQTAGDPVAAAGALTGLEVEAVDPGFRHAKFDILLDQLGDVSVFGYNPQVFDAATVELLADRWAVLLERIADAPELPVMRLPLLAPGERERLLAWSDGGPAEPCAGGVLAAVTRAARLTPEAAAIACGADVVSYGELAERAGALAARLREAGVRPGDLVGVSMPRSPDAIVALVAVWTAGAGYVPLDPAYPAARRAAMASDAGVTHVITPDGINGTAAEHGGAGERGVAYVLYTSGSTGAPKGVAVGHRALDTRVGWMAGAYGLGPGDRVVQFSSLGFDTHAEEVWPALATGATLVLLPDGPESLPDVLAHDPDISVLDLPTAYWHRLVEVMDEIRWPPRLRLVILGGEQAQAPAVAAWLSRFGGTVRLVNTYGPTEATIIATWAELRDGDHRPPIGRPLGGTRVHVLADDLSLVPEGVPGELCIGGDGLADGYVGLAELTAARFVADPYGPPGARLYRTGDRARWRPGGTLEFLGRLDDQVKVRGHRVEPGEVEARLLSHPGVSQAAVVAVDDALVAYVVGSAAPAEVRAHAALTLPGHMVPGVVVPLDRLPLTPAGKVDARALRAPRFERDPAMAFTAPRTDAEQLVTAIWAEVLGLDQVGVEDDFFAIGGHSLHAVRVMSRIRSIVELDVPIKELFAHSTAAALAAVLEDLLIAEISRLSDEETERLLSTIEDTRP